MRSVLLLVVAIGVFSTFGAFGTERGKMDGMKIASPAFAHSARIPAHYTCDGADASPPLTFHGVPAGTRSLALIVDDPDAPVGTWVHWVVWNIPPGTVEIGENAVPAGALQGRNDWGHNRYGGPCPPSGSHRYFFRLYALDVLLSLGASATKRDLERAMKGHVVAQTDMMGVYARR